MFKKFFPFFIVFFYGCESGYTGGAQIKISDYELFLATQQRGGVPKPIVVTNVGKISAKNVGIELNEEQINTGITISSHDCPTELKPGQSCTIYVSPGVFPYGLENIDVEQDEILQIKGENTNIEIATLQVLDFGSPFQGGLVFAINADATTIKVLANVTLANTMNAGWVRPAFSPFLPPEANDFYDGRGNTKAMVDFYAYGTFAALSCANYEVGADSSTPCSDEDDIPCYRNWYLPAICELAPDPFVCPIAVDNIYSNLYLAGNNNLQTTLRWSSTIDDPLDPIPKIYAAAFSIPTPSGIVGPTDASANGVVRCVRLFEHI